MVSSDDVSDDQSHVLPRHRHRIENEMTYPGQIKVNVIRRNAAPNRVREVKLV